MRQHYLKSTMKTGQQMIVTGDTYGHEIPIGEVATIRQLFGEYNGEPIESDQVACEYDGYVWLVSVDELVKVGEVVSGDDLRLIIEQAIRGSKYVTSLGHINDVIDKCVDKINSEFLLIRKR